MTITKLRTNHLVNPIGYGFDPPTVSWVTEDTQGKKQTAAWVRVFTETEKGGVLAGTPVFDSGKRGDISSLAYPLPLKLEPCTRYFWKVEVWADNGERAESGWAFFETGKMGSPWEARWIRADLNKDEHPYLRKDFTLEGEAVWARAYACGLGLYELEINGRKVGGEYLMPGYHAYDCFLQYQSYDILEYLRTGNNAIGAMLGPGWYKGRFIFEGGAVNIYGDVMEFICEVRVRFKDGRELAFGSGLDWRGHPSPVLFSNIYDGEVYSALREISGWSSPGCSADGWLPSIPTGRTTEDLTERVNPPLVIHERIRPEKLVHTDTDEWVLDFGQEITGWVEFCPAGVEPGREIKLSYGEILQEGRFYRDNLRTAKAEYVYVPGSDTTRENSNTVVARPHFTFYGFRFVKVEGMGEPDPADFTAYALYSDIEQSGWIETSHPGINRLFLNTLWSQKDNFLDIPTDCPQRDERMGWTGDAAIFAETANQQMYTPAFFNHYLKNLEKEQEKSGGAVPFFVPLPKPDFGRKDIPFWGSMPSSTVWGDVASILPWSLYVMYGDRELLRGHYRIIREWADYSIARDEADDDKGLWQTGFHLGDWLALDSEDSQSPKGATDVHFIASAFYYHTVTIATKAAAILGYAEDAEKYSARREKIRTAFIRTYFNEAGGLAIRETQTALAVALHFELFPAGKAQKLLDALVRRIRAKQNHLDTGFVGTPLLCLTLSRYGANETAYSLLLQKTYPSWLYEVGMGATTIWERWNSVLPDGRISGTGMNSLNHYSYGAITNWMYQYMCGLRPLEESPGFKKARIAPMPDRRIKRIRMARDTAAGRYEISWEWRDDGGINYIITIPFDCEAVIALPGREEFIALSGRHQWIITAPGKLPSIS
jgi:alpha-L-rhamnosidase